MKQRVAPAATAHTATTPAQTAAHRRSARPARPGTASPSAGDPTKASGSTPPTPAPSPIGTAHAPASPVQTGEPTAASPVTGTSANSSGVLTRALIPVRFATASPGTPSAITIAAHNPSWLDPFAISLHAISATTRHPSRHARAAGATRGRRTPPSARGLVLWLVLAQGGVAALTLVVRSAARILGRSAAEPRW